MNLRFMPEAENALFEIGIWVEGRNTVGSGIRFTHTFIDKITPMYYLMSSTQSVRTKFWLRNSFAV